MYDLNAVAEIAAVIEERLGRFWVWCVCPHAPENDCECRKPRPGLIIEAVEVLRADITRTVVIGDSLSDVEAARAAGAYGLGVGQSKPTTGDIPWFEGLGDACNAAIAYAMRSGLPAEPWRPSKTY